METEHTVGICYQAATGEDTEDLVRSLVCGLARALYYM
jgi:hypothetical protein